MKNPDIPVNIFYVLLLLLQLFKSSFSSSDDITNIYYFGCRSFGGISNMVSCNCTPEAKEMYIQKNSIPGFDVSIIEIHNCAQVRIGAYSIQDLRNLRTVFLNNIQSLTLERDSLNWVGYRDIFINQEERFDLRIPSLKIIIRNSHITNIESKSFVGRINEINIADSTIDKIESFAFHSLLQTENLIFTNVMIKEIQPQAFKKFGSEIVVFDGVVADNLPSRTFFDVTIYRSFAIRNCRFNTLRTATFTVNNVDQLSVTNTDIQQLDGEAFLVSTRGDVLIRDNTFHNVQDYAFMGITLSGTSSVRSINFDSNTFGSLERYSLEVQPQFQTIVHSLNLNESCDCNNIVDNIRKSEFYSEIRCLSSEQDFITISSFKSQNCSIFAGYYYTIAGVSVVLLLICLFGALFYVYYWYMYRRQKYGCKKEGKPPMSLIVPDGRTYKETELHVIVEKADLLTTDL